MKMKLFALLSMVLVLTMALSACGGTPPANENTKPADPSQAGDASEPAAGTAVDISKALTISIFEQADDNPEFTLDNNPVINYWEGLYNLDVEWQQPPQGSEQDQLTMMLGTGDYTDVIDIGFNQENLGTLYEDGVIPAADAAQIDGLQQALRNELDRQPVDEAAARNLALELASARYIAIGNHEYETIRLRRLFERHVPMQELDAELLHSTVSAVQLRRDKVSIRLKNGQIIEGSQSL